jgi:UDP-N-acetylglucosamine--N-acetylmuramyl-(pentapeptide) pyrophosphoryl-undecaprenol N-acetylglucosamine transferase
MAGAPLLVIAAGGTGGHMFPAQALAEEMLARGWRVVLSTDARGARYAGGFPPEVRRETVRSATLSQGGIAARLMAPLVIAAGVFTAWRAMGRDRPAVVAGFGGYPAIPALAAAWLRRIPRLIHEQNGVPGRVNRLFARHVAAFACGIWPTAVPSGVRTVHTGNPVRQAVADLHGTHYRPPSEHSEIALLVIGGSQGASALARLVPAAAALLPAVLRPHLAIAQQARAEDAAGVEAAYAAAGIRAEIQPFFADVPQRMAGCQLVISRAGASSLADIAVIGRPSILIPYPAATDDHQTANARPLAGSGAAVLLPEAGLTAEALAAQMAAVLTDPERALGMAAAAAAAGRPDAAARLADLAENIAGKDKTR